MTLKQKRKGMRIFALLLAVVLLLGVLPLETVFAASVADTGKPVSVNLMPYATYTDIPYLDAKGTTHHMAGGMGNYMHMLSINNNYVYCIQPYLKASSSTYTAYSGDSITAATDSWNTMLTEDEREAITLAMLYGYPNVDYSTSSKTYSAEVQYAATQLIIWEIVTHQRQATSPYYRTGSEAYNAFSYTSTWKDVPTIYNQIASRMALHGKLPSFMYSTEQEAKDATSGISLTYNSQSGAFEGSVTDTNGVLENFAFPQSGYTANGNTLNISISSRTAASAVVSSTSSTILSEENAAMLVWDEGNATGTEVGQTMVCLTTKTVDPVVGYFKLVPNITTGSLLITKTSDDGVVSGVTFTVQDNDTGESYTVVTNGSGTASLNDITAGSYTVTESVPVGYRCTSGSQTVTVPPGGTGTVSFQNTVTPVPLTIIKTSEDGDVQGIGFTIAGTAVNGNSYSKHATTDANGKISLTDLYPGTYTITEDASDKYTATEPQTITIGVGEESREVSFSNTLATDTLTIQKTSEDDQVSGITFAVSGTTTTGTTYSGTATTDENGVAQISGLKPGTYTIVENTPDYYVPQDTREVTLPYGGQTVSVSFGNSLKRGTLVVEKTAEYGTVSGRQFHLYGTARNGSTVDLYATTDDSGKAYFTDVLISSENGYTLEEVEVPAYYVEPEAQTVSIQYGETTTVTVANLLKTGTLEVQKDSEDGTVAEILFHLSGTSLSGKTVDAYATTNKKGKAVFEDIPISGDTPYVLEEVNTPIRYVVPDAQNIAISYSKTTETTVENLLKKWTATISKRDSEFTEEAASLVTGNRYLITDAETDSGYSGHAVSISDAEKNMVLGAMYLTAGTDPTADTLVAQMIRDSYDYNENTTSVQAVVEAMFPDAADCGLPTEDPEFQTVLDAYNDVFVQGNSAVQNKILAIAADGTDYSAYGCEVLLTYSAGETDFVCWTADTGDYLNGDSVLASVKGPQGDAVLSGAVYGVYQNGELLDQYTTDASGSFTTKEYPTGADYTVKEISPSVGYLLDTKETAIGIDSGETEVALTQLSYVLTEDVIQGKIQLVKHHDDGTTKIETPEAGATFQVFLKSAGSYEAAEDHERDKLVCDSDGYAVTKDLPFGTYTVHQIAGDEDAQLLEDFDVTISQDGKVYKYILNNAFISAWVKIVKTDATTNKSIPLADTAFQIYDSEGELVTMVTTYPNVVVHDTFYTDDSGMLITPSSLPYGTYEIMEVTAPEGYVRKQTGTKFQISTEGVTYEAENTPVITVKVANTPQMGTITLTKRGEVFQSVTETDGLYTAVYEEAPLEGATYSIFAAEDIYTKDGSLRVSQDTLVDSMTTTSNGTAVSKNLYLGKYYLVETQAPTGYVLDSTPISVELTYADQNVSVTDIAASAADARQKADITLTKAMEARLQQGDNAELEDVRFGLYAADEITAQDGSVIPKDGLLEVIGVDEEGNGAFSADIPFGTYYVQEVATNGRYILDDTQYSFEFSYSGQFSPTVSIDINKGNVLINYVASGWVRLHKVDADHPEVSLSQAVFAVYEDTEADGEYNAETDPFFAYMIGISDGQYLLEVPVGSWLVRELKAPMGYTLDETYYPVTVENKTDVTLETQADVGFTETKTRVVLTKTDAQTGDGLEDAVLRVYSALTDDVVFSGPTDKDGSVEIVGLTPGTYYFEEAVSPAGYIRDTEMHEFVLLPNGEVTGTTSIADVPNSITITKTDITNEAPVPGAEITVYDSEDNIYYKNVTDENGEITISHLPAGNYTFKETITADGFVLNEDTYAFTVDPDGNITGDDTISDLPTTVVIQKVDQDTEDTVPGATITVYNADGSEYASVVTDENGEAIFPYVPQGSYTWSETAAPDGYVIDHTIYNFTVDETGTPSGDNILYQQPSTVVLHKVDANTGDAIPGAVIQIFREDGTVLYTGVTDENGEISVSYIPRGDYSFREMLPADGYQMNQQEYYFTILLDGSVAGEDTIADQPTKVVLTKQDFTTADPVSGAEITIYDQDGNVFYSGVTGEDGTITVEYVPAGEYTFQEVTPPDGYQQNETVFTFTVDQFGAVYGDDTVTDEPTNVVLTKVDALTGQPLSGVEITIFDAKGAVYTTATTDENGQVSLTYVPRGTYTYKETGTVLGYTLSDQTGTFVVDSTGAVSGELVLKNTPTTVTITKTDLTNSDPVPGATITIYDSDNNIYYTGITDDDGKISLTYIPQGTYTFRETITANGYVINDETFTFTIDENGNVTGDTTIHDAPTNVVITKADEVTKNPIPGATISVYDGSGNLYAQEVTDSNGQITLSKVPQGSYTYLETGVPSGYAKNPLAYSFTVDYTGNVSGDYVMLEKPTSVSILKTSSVSGNPLSGAEIGVYDAANTEVYKETTGEDGKITISYLAPGTYTFKELTAPEGYSLNETVFTFTVDKNGAVTGDLEIQDTPSNADLVISKVDMDTGKPVKGAKISVYDKQSNLVYSGTSDEDGKFTIGQLEPGTYSFLETEAPSGYIQSRQTYSFTVTEDGVAEGTLTLKNKAVSVSQNTNASNSSTTSSTANTTTPTTGNLNWAVILLMLMAACIGGIGGTAIWMKVRRFR